MAGAACAPLRSAPFPLYPPPVLAPAEVATLTGPIATVDGVEVPPKPSYALLPGCHVVVLQSRIGEGGLSGAWSTEIRHPGYVFQMKAGHIYTIEVRLLPGSNLSVGTATVGGVKITAVEQDPSGRTLATIAPARNRATLAACAADSESPSP